MVGVVWCGMVWRGVLCCGECVVMCLSVGLMYGGVWWMGRSMKGRHDGSDLLVNIWLNGC